MKMEDRPNINLTLALAFTKKKKNVSSSSALKLNPQVIRAGKESPTQIEIAEKQLRNGCLNVG